MRKPKGDKVDGWLILDKPAGLTSAQAVGRVRRLFNAAKAGHAGTLDPLATGVLPIALGEATKTMPYMVEGTKTYRFTVAWGERRTTDDAEGAVTETSAVRPDTAQIEAALPGFRGDIAQVPPVYSAIKLAGRPAYARARAGEAVTLAPRTIRIDRLALVNIPDRNHAEFIAECGKGTYIRGLTRDIALALGTVGYVAALRRLAVGRFTENDAIPLDKLEGLGHIPARLAYLRPVETALDDIPALAVTEADALRLRQGQAVQIPRAADSSVAGPISGQEGVRAWRPGQVVYATLADRPVAIARLDGDNRQDMILRPLRVLNL
ncbi:MAG: tRNA pseudouridine(55) synthase TruB [Rhodospirillales bacterium]|nr:tRNA pseudouridine(55) synthase TruB [Rhodospirillales bacterium]